jgi:hypothetical protein
LSADEVVERANDACDLVGDVLLTRFDAAFVSIDARLPPLPLDALIDVLLAIDDDDDKGDDDDAINAVVDVDVA